MTDKAARLEGNYSNFLHQLYELIGKTVIIHTMMTGDEGKGFTGILLSVNESYIRLVTRAGSPPQYKGMEEPQKRNKGYYQSIQFQDHFGTITLIPINKLVAITYNTP